MALVIRMREQGASSRQQFRIVLTDIRHPRDGKYHEKLGWYHPFGNGTQNFSLDMDRFRFWVDCGAQVSDRVQALVKKVAPEVMKEMRAKVVAKRVKERERQKKRGKGTGGTKGAQNLTQTK